MPCDVQRARTRQFWGPDGRGATAGDAYEAAVARLKALAVRWADRMRQQMTCPDGCANPHAFRYSVEQLAVDGYFSWRTNQCVLRVKARFHAQWICDPVGGGRPTPPPEEPLPGEELGGGSAGPAVVDQPTGDQPDEEACDVTIEMQNNCSVTGLGIVDWTIDLSFEADASNADHSWPQESCVIREVTLQKQHGTGSTPADATLNGVGAVAGQRHDLMEERYSLTIENGAGHASVTGVLRGGGGLPLAASDGSVIYVSVEATDSNGDTTTRLFGPILPRP